MADPDDKTERPEDIVFESTIPDPNRESLEANADGWQPAGVYRLEDELEVLGLVERNHDYLRQFSQQVSSVRQAYLEENRFASAGEHFAATGIRFIQVLDSTAPVEVQLLPLKSYGLGLNVPRGFELEETHRKILEAFNATFLFDSDYAGRRPDEALDYVVLPGQRYMSRTDFEAWWCRERVRDLLDVDRLVDETWQLAHDHLPRTDFVRVTLDGEFEYARV